MDQLQTILSQSNFDAKKAEIYLILAQNGKLTVPQIQEKTPINRTTIYTILTELLADGYISYEKDGRTAYYSPNHPDTLNRLIQEKEQENAQFKRNMGDVISTLSGAYSTFSQKPGVRFLQGFEAVKEIYEDILESSDYLYSLVPSGVRNHDFHNWIESDFVPKRAKKGVKTKLILNSEGIDEAYKNESEKFLREIRLVPKESFPIDTEIKIYGKDKVAFLSIHDDQCMGTIVQNPLIHETMTSFFHLAWEGATKLQQKKSTSD